MFFGRLRARRRLPFGGVASHGGGVVALDAALDGAQLVGLVGVVFGALARAVARKEGEDAEHDEQQDAFHLASLSATPWLVTMRSTALPVVSRSTAQP